MNFLRLATTALLFSAIAACSSVPRFVNEYKIDIQQGNVLSQDMVSQLRPGLTKDQVRYILGTPVLTDMFHASRWEYFYSLRKGNSGDTERRKFTVFFDADGKLIRVAGDVAAASTGEAVRAGNAMQELDLGSVGADVKAPPQQEERGFFGRILEKVGF
ncbi:outer membrane protein assembly factor BamE [Propionivibrio dicarboxylicus]|uniref:Outer membrane protein assembly factor BamE n=1 Tax=Propionivibrio dicarboxylicus TaxID=83767 RepID=A0A1G8G5C3_9RHOO|nr:outer membrane protein assembly factor BamE [Propionivibrio dicarboxylicus]SDH89579.1 Beta-barrel assembly machine subunit BamE [Propionivibrio dicarboxylicus]